MTARSLISRPLDLFYIIFFAIHIPTTLFSDLPAIIPRSIAPSWYFKLPDFYVAMSQDPLIGGAMGIIGKSGNFAWFKSFLLLEVLFQLPTFVLGIRGLLRDSKSIYVLLLIYGASTATTTLPCVAYILDTPLTSADTIASNTVSITPEQRSLLLYSYVPFFLIPLLIAIDMAFRVSHLAHAGVRAQTAKKRA